MKKTMKLTYLLSLLVLLFSFTACGDSNDKNTDKDDTKVEDNKDKDSKEDTEYTEDTEDTEDTSSKEDGSSDANASTGSATLADISFNVSDEWTLDDSSVEDSALYYYLPSSTDNFGNNFIVQVTDVGTEVSDEELQNSADLFIQTYEENFDATLVDQSTVDTACGTAMVFTLDVTKMIESQGVTGYTAYIKQAIFVNGTKTYIVQLTCLSDDFDALSKEMDNVLSSITLK